MGGMITTNPDFNLDEILPKLKEYTVTDAVKTVSRTEKEHFNGDGFKVALLDLGTKNNIIRSLEKRGCDVTVYPADTTAEEILGDQPDGIMLSNGPGDPKECVQIIKEIKEIYDSEGTYLCNLFRTSVDGTCNRCRHRKNALGDIVEEIIR